MDSGKLRNFWIVLASATTAVADGVSYAGSAIASAAGATGVVIASAAGTMANVTVSACGVVITPITAGVSALSHATASIFPPEQARATHIVNTKLSFDIGTHPFYNSPGRYAFRIFDNTMPGFCLICYVCIFENGLFVETKPSELTINSEKQQLSDRLKLLIKHHQESPKDSYITSTMNMVIRHFKTLRGFEKEKVT